MNYVYERIANDGKGNLKANQNLNAQTDFRYVWPRGFVLWSQLRATSIWLNFNINWSDHRAGWSNEILMISPEYLSPCLKSVCHSNPTLIFKWMHRIFLNVSELNWMGRARDLGRDEVDKLLFCFSFWTYTCQK